MRTRNIAQIVLLILASLLWGHAMITSRTDMLSFSPFGLAESLSVSFWIGLSICVCLFVFNLRSSNGSLFLLVLPLVLLLFFVYLTPCVIESNPRFPDTYLHMGNARSVLSTGNANPDNLYYTQYFPGFFIFMAILMGTTGIPSFVIMKYYPPLLMSMISLLIYLLAYGLTRSKRCSLLAPFFFTSFAWFAEFHVSPESFDIVLCILAVSLLFKMESVRLANVVPMFIVMTTVMVSNPTAALFLLSFLFVLCLLERSRKSKIAFSFLLSIFGAWVLLESSIPETVASALSRIYENGFSPTGVFSKLFAHGSTSLTSAQMLLDNLRVGQIVAFWLVFGIIVLTTLLLYNKKAIERQILRLLAIWAGSCSLVGILIFINSQGLLERVGLFSLIPISVAAAYFFSIPQSRRYLKILLICTISVSCLLLPVTYYGNESYEYVSSATITSENFIVSSARNVRVVGYWPTFAYWHVEINKNNMTLIDIRNSENGSILVFEQIYRNYYIMRMGNYTIEKEIQDYSNQLNTDQIYDNGFSVVFVKG